MVETAVKEQPGAGRTVGPGIDLQDIQGLLRWGFGGHPEAVTLLFRVKDCAAARLWLNQVKPTTAFSRDSDTVLQVALTGCGMQALKIPQEIIEGFSEEFIKGMAGDENRARRLGDVGSNTPDRWEWGSGAQVPHVAVLLYAHTGRLEAFRRSIETQCAAGFELLYPLTTLRRRKDDNAEPFGFQDGLSQPELDWGRGIPAKDREQLSYNNLSCLGEFILGYPNEYGLFTPRPQLDARKVPAHSLPQSEEYPDKADIGRNGSYLVIRQLRQDVDTFWKEMDERAHGIAAERERLAALLVGRTRNGDPLVAGATGSVGSKPNNNFTFESDSAGYRCPIGAHIRRANPRTADLPPGSNSLLSKLIRTLGLKSASRARDLAASARFHRLVRRGRKYESGLHFICLNANIQRQFEFVQGAWLMSTQFNGLHEESDPLLGNRIPGAAATPCDYFTMPQTKGPTQRLAGLPQFVTVLGGAYFFLPGIRALRFLTRD